jgi:hypothetical protein
MRGNSPCLPVGAKGWRDSIQFVQKCCSFDHFGLLLRNLNPSATSQRKEVDKNRHKAYPMENHALALKASGPDHRLSSVHPPRDTPVLHTARHGGSLHTEYTAHQKMPWLPSHGGIITIKRMSPVRNLAVGSGPRNATGPFKLPAGRAAAPQAAVHVACGAQEGSERRAALCHVRPKPGPVRRVHLIPLRVKPVPHAHRSARAGCGTCWGGGTRP